MKLETIFLEQFACGCAPFPGSTTVSVALLNSGQAFFAGETPAPPGHTQLKTALRESIGAQTDRCYKKFSSERPAK
jgi:hypothetical protein